MNTGGAWGGTGGHWGAWGAQGGHRGAQGGTAAACLHSTAGTTYPPSVGGRGAALPLKPHYLHDHRGCPRSPANLRDRNSSHEIGAILIAYEDLGYVPHNLTVGYNRDPLQDSRCIAFYFSPGILVL